MIMILNFLVCLFTLSLNGSVCPLTQKEAYENSWKFVMSDKRCFCIANYKMPFFINNIDYSFDYDQKNRKFVSLRAYCGVTIYSDPEPNDKVFIADKYTDSWDECYQKDIVFHNGQIFFIQQSVLYQFSEQSMSIVKQWSFEQAYYRPTLNPDPEHVLLLTQKDSVNLPYGHSKSALFKMVTNGQEVELSCGDSSFAWYYLQGKKDDCIQFSFLTTNGLKKNFSLNPKISGIVIDIDVAEQENKNGHYNVQQDGGPSTFYKIMKTKNGVPFILMGMKLSILHSSFDIKDCIRPNFIPTDENIEISDESVNGLKESRIFESFSLSKWTFKKKKDSNLKEQSPVKKRIPPQEERPKNKSFFYKQYVLLCFYSVDSLYSWIVIALVKKAPV